MEGFPPAKLVARPTDRPRIIKVAAETNFRLPGSPTMRPRLGRVGACLSKPVGTCGTVTAGIGLRPRAQHPGTLNDFIQSTRPVQSRQFRPVDTFDVGGKVLGGQ